MNIDKIIDYYYKENGALRSILLTHSRMVAEKALRIADSHRELTIDRDFVYRAAMLHDIGIVCCDAPGIECHGTEPYLRHGVCGADMLRRDAHLFALTADEIEPYARVCERHTGSGLTQEDILRQGLLLPLKDFLPETLEEKLICYADKFYSKTRLEDEKSFEHVLRSMQKFGMDSEQRFIKLHDIFR